MDVATMNNMLCKDLFDKRQPKVKTSYDKRVRMIATDIYNKALNDISMASLDKPSRLSRVVFGLWFRFTQDLLGSGMKAAELIKLCEIIDTQVKAEKTGRLEPFTRK